MTFEFATAGRILFGRGSFQKIAGLASGLGIDGPARAGTERARRRGAHRQAWKRPVLRAECFHVEGEPTIHLVDQASGGPGRHGCDLVIAVGGGSVIDTGKAVAAMLTNPGDVLDYLEVVGGGKALDIPACPSSPCPPRPAPAPRPRETPCWACLSTR